MTHSTDDDQIESELPASTALLLAVLNKFEINGGLKWEWDAKENA